MWLILIGRGAGRADGHRIVGTEDRKGWDFVWMKGSGCFLFLRTHERTDKFFNHPSPSLLPWDKRAAGGGRGPARALGQQAARRGSGCAREQGEGALGLHAGVLGPGMSSPGPTRHFLTLRNARSLDGFFVLAHDGRRRPYRSSRRGQGQSSRVGARPAGRPATARRSCWRGGRESRPGAAEPGRACRGLGSARGEADHGCWKERDGAGRSGTELQQRRCGQGALAGGGAYAAHAGGGARRAHTGDRDGHRFNLLHVLGGTRPPASPGSARIATQHTTTGRRKAGRERENERAHLEPPCAGTTASARFGYGEGD
jgi:hypothetical protein